MTPTEAKEITSNFKVVNYLDYKVTTILDADPLYRNSIYMALGNVFNAACGFFFWMIAARLYTIEEVGLATALISSLGLVVILSRLGFDFSIIRFYPSENKSKIFGTSLVVTTVASMLVGGAYILLAESLVPPLAFLKEPSFALVFFLIGIVNSVAAMTGSAFIADRKADQYLFQNLFMALRVPLLIPLAFLGSYGIFGSLGLAYLLASFFALLNLQRCLLALRLEVDFGFLRRAFKFSSWNYVSNLLTMAPTLILPIMILNVLGEAEAAKYYIAYTIGTLVLIIPSSLGTSLFVEGSHGEELKKSVVRAGKASVTLLIPTVLMLCLFGDRLLGLLKGEYVEAFDLVRILALSSFPVTVYYLFIPAQNVRMNVESIVKLNIIRFVLLLGLSYILIQKYGIIGVGYGWMITYGIIVLVIGRVVRKERMI